MKIPAAILAAVVLAAAAPPTQPEPAAKDDPAFVSIFDGKTLNGWQGDPKYWRVEDGVLIGEITPETVVRQNTFVIWRGGAPGDFELKMDYRISDRGNSGVNYRSSELTDPPLAMRGYQFDIDGERRNNNGVRYTGQNYEERGRTFLALRGQTTRLEEGKKPQIVASLGEDKDLRAAIKDSDWNELHIIASGNTLVHILNGRVVSVVVDDDAKNRTMAGLIGMQVHVGGPMKIEYRNIRLKNLDKPTPAAAKPTDVAK